MILLATKNVLSEVAIIFYICTEFRPLTSYVALST